VSSNSGVSMSQSSDGGELSRPSPAAVATLLVKSGFYEGLEVQLEASKNVIGRGRSADIVLAEPTISREHALIGWNPDGWYVEDLGSTNGSHVNGSRLTRHLLKRGDEIVIGKLIVEVTLPTDA
jgi:pSer/pThr/pTyr-binding forkhead associated (FHA) protein